MRVHKKRRHIRTFRIVCKRIAEKERRAYLEEKARRHRTVKKTIKIANESTSYI